METPDHTTPEQTADLHYDRPAIVDYGTLVELTQAGNLTHSDIPHGAPNTSYPS